MLGAQVLLLCYSRCSVAFCILQSQHEVGGGTGGAGQCKVSWSPAKLRRNLATLWRGHRSCNQPYRQHHEPLRKKYECRRHSLTSGRLLLPRLTIRPSAKAHSSLSALCCCSLVRVLRLNAIEASTNFCAAFVFATIFGLSTYLSFLVPTKVYLT
jgi:hypothetical protein